MKEMPSTGIMLEEKKIRLLFLICGFTLARNEVYFLENIRHKLGRMGNLMVKRIKLIFSSSTGEIKSCQKYVLYIKIT